MRSLFLAILCTVLCSCTSLPAADLDVVSVEIVVADGTPEVLERVLVDPLEHSLHRWSGIDSIKSTMTEKNVRIELEFRHSPTDREIKDVRAAEDVATSDSGLRLISVVVAARRRSLP